VNSFLELATKRRSIRKFQDKDVPDEDVKYFIDAAVRAPSVVTANVGSLWL